MGGPAPGPTGCLPGWRTPVGSGRRGTGATAGPGHGDHLCPLASPRAGPVDAPARRRVVVPGRGRGGRGSTRPSSPRSRRTRRSGGTKTPPARGRDGRVNCRSSPPLRRSGSAAAGARVFRAPDRRRSPDPWRDRGQEGLVEVGARGAVGAPAVGGGAPWGILPVRTVHRPPPSGCGSAAARASGSPGHHKRLPGGRHRQRAAARAGGQPAETVCAPTRGTPRRSRSPGRGSCWASASPSAGFPGQAETVGLLGMFAGLPGPSPVCSP